MARFGILLAFSALQRTIHGAFAPDNPRTKYRQDPSLFGTVWETPMLLSGQPASSEALTDLVIHSKDPIKRELWVDYLYPSAWELDFEAKYISAWCRQWWWMACVASTLYLIGLWGVPLCMKDRKAFDLRKPMALWNLFLALFSLVGAVRTVPHLFVMLKLHGFEYTVCRAAIVSYGSGAAGFWVALFVFSKYFELIDTVFLVLRKKQVPFLHWYHHCSVLLYCWHAYVVEMPTGIYFAGMNYTVHAVMYFYYFLAAVLAKPPKWARMVTVLQISQMVVGIVITIIHLHKMVYVTVPHCDGHITNLAGALGMYASYFILFAQFFARRYAAGPRAKEKPEKKVE